MTIEKINFHYPRKSVQSVYSHEEMTALELAAATAGKVDQCIDRVNGVEQIAIEATNIVDLMKAQQDAFILANDDTRAQMLIDNQELLDSLQASNTLFQNDVNNSKATYESDMNTSLSAFKTDINNRYDVFVTDMDTAISTIIANSESLINIEVSTKIDSLVTDGTITGLINNQILNDVKSDISSNEKTFFETTGAGFINGMNVLQQNTPNMTVIITAGIAHLPTGKRYELFTDLILNIPSADTSYPRKDIIVVSKTGITLKQGTPSATPTPQVKGADELILAEIYVPVGKTSIVSSDIVDMRNIKPNLIDINNRVKNNQGQISSINDTLALHQERLSDIYKNVKSYGAKGDGITDDTNAIQAALNSFDDAGGILYFPKGHYLVSQPLIFPTLSTDALITPYIKILGANGVSTGTIDERTCTLFNYTGDGALFDLRKGTNANTTAICSFEGFNAKGTSKTGTKCINGFKMTGAIFQNLAISHFDEGINIFDYSWYSVYSTLKITNCLTYGINFGQKVNGSTIRDSVFNANGTAGLRFYYGGVNISIDGCWFELNGDHGIIIIESQHVNINNCYFEDNTVGCISFSRGTGTMAQLNLNNCFCNLMRGTRGLTLYGNINVNLFGIQAITPTAGLYFCTSGGTGKVNAIGFMSVNQTMIVAPAASLNVNLGNNKDANYTKV